MLYITDFISNFKIWLPDHNQMTFQYANNSFMREIINLHHDIMLLVVSITIFVLYLLVYIVMNDINRKELNEGSVWNHSHWFELEFVWTVIPALLLTILISPSIHCVYFWEKTNQSHCTFKVLGHQWYWSYEEVDRFNPSWLDETLAKPTTSFDSYLILDEHLSDAAYPAVRLFSCYKHAVLPVFTSIRLLVSSADVLHSWSVPALGIKIDACPGRLNQVYTALWETGVYYGQCSEICGIGHGFMPIMIVGLSWRRYVDFFLDGVWLTQPIK